MTGKLTAYVPAGGAVSAVIWWQLAQITILQGLILSLVVILLIELIILARKLDRGSRQLRSIEAQSANRQLELASQTFHPILHGGRELLCSLHLIQRADLIDDDEDQTYAKRINNDAVSRLRTLRDFLLDYSQTDDFLLLSRRFNGLETSKRKAIIHEYQQEFSGHFAEWQPSDDDSFAIRDASYSGSNLLLESKTLQEAMNSIVQDIDSIISRRRKGGREEKHSLSETEELLTRAIFVLDGLGYAICYLQFDCSFREFLAFSSFAAHGVLIGVIETVKHIRKGKKKPDAGQK